MPTLILFAVKIGDPDWKEQIITERAELIEEAQKWASENGFDRFRILRYEGEKPDFVGTIGGKHVHHS